MSDILCVTNRRLMPGEAIFLQQIERIARCHPAGIILREKDLTEKEYRELARRVLQTCERYGTQCILHGFADTALELGADAIHLPLPFLRALDPEKRKKFRVLGVSCHSAEDAREAQALGCTYITAGHIFDTDCKAGLPGRGLDFLREVCESTDLPVFAIGGINKDNISDIRRAGAAGACVMSGCMQCEDAEEYLSGFSEAS
ncbi:MAG: thiamine phosphate synthase [Clostridiales bacterium]|nr:thiamine phosphate synthase [Clostridiales bacterium]